MITNTIIYLYVKQHSITGMKYFGKTIKINPFKYKGSGTYWLRHVKKHDLNFIKTLEVWGFDDKEICTEFALKFSKDNNIVESKEWANLIDENGVDGQPKGYKLTSYGYEVDNVFQLESVKIKIRETNLRKYGVEYPQQSSIIKETTLKNNISKYGCYSYSCTQESKDKFEKTSLERYGTKNPMQSDFIKNKTKATNIIKYGVESVAQNPDVITKMLYTRKILSERQIVQLIRKYKNMFNFVLKRGWYQQSDEKILEIFIKIQLEFGIYSDDELDLLELNKKHSKPIKMLHSTPNVI